MMKRYYTTALLLLAGLLVAPLAHAQFNLSTDDIFVNESVTVTLPQRAETLVVTYRPGSSIARTESIPTNGAQTVAWTPTQAGVVALAVPDGPSQNVSVRFRGAPVSGLAVLLLAGGILFGGAIFAFRKLFQDDRPSSKKVALRPDT